MLRKQMQLARYVCSLTVHYVHEKPMRRCLMGWNEGQQVVKAEVEQVIEG